MPFIMGLEGPRPSPARAASAQLLGAVPRPFWRAQAELAGIFTPVTSRPLLAVGALLFGAWLAGSKSGQRLVSRVRRR